MENGTEPNPMKNTQHRIVMNDGANARRKMPSMLAVKPTGSAYATSTFIGIPAHNRLHDG
nr:hypothetical protein P5665_00785 [Bacillus subtilis]